MVIYISEWLRKLIILILIAALVDLLLPDTNMQRYARLTIGLLIILTMLSPILAIFSMDNLGQVISRNGLFMREGTSSGTDFSEIERKADALNKIKQQELIKQFATNFQYELEAEIERRYQTKAEVKVDISIAKGSEAKIDKIVVYLLGRVHKKDNKDNLINPNESQTAISTIEIKIGEENEHDSVNDTIQNEGMSQMKTEVESFLISNYQLTSNQVEIRIQNGRN